MVVNTGNCSGRSLSRNRRFPSSFRPCRRRWSPAGDAPKTASERERQGGQGGRRPPAGKALTARKVLGNTMVRQARQACYPRCSSVWIELLGSLVIGSVAVRSPGPGDAGRAAENPGAGSLFVALAATWSVFGRSLTGSIKCSTTPPHTGAMTGGELAPGCVRVRSHPPLHGPAECSPTP